MRIIENRHEGCELYSDALKEKVEDTFLYAARFAELQKLLEGIKAEADRLHGFFMTEKESAARKALLAYFDARVQSMVIYTKKNMETYRLNGWQQLIEDGEHDDDGNR